MLIEFKVANFRSIREEQVFSLVANKADKELEACLINRNLPGLLGLKYLKGAAIYGANASGKSNIIKAIRFLHGLILGSAVNLKPGDKTGTEPFKLDRNSLSKPSKFEISFVIKETRFVFGVSVTSERVVDEYLVAFPKGLPQRWYRRTFNETKKCYKWTKSSYFSMDKKLREKTRENSLFLSVAPQFNHEQLTTIFNWFKNNLYFMRLSAEEDLNHEFTAKHINDPIFHDRIINLLKSADVGVIDAKVEELDSKLSEIKENLNKAPQEDKEIMKKLHDVIDALQVKMGKDFPKELRVSLLHKAEDESLVALDFHEESAGTRRFFALAGPWIDILNNGYTVFIDEIETSLHPLLVKELLRLLFCNKNNPQNAQVVFATHSPILLDGTLMRRDQIWFTEKTPVGATHLYSLTDYQPRKDEALAKGYLAGRYGAVPYIPKGLEM